MSTTTVQRHEVEAWVNPSAWDDPAEAAAVIDAILASGTTDEEAWVKLAGGAIADQEAAAERARDHIADALDEHIARVDAARAGLAESIRGRDDAIRAVIAGGASAYRVAQVTGLSQGLVARIRHAQVGPHKGGLTR